MGKKKKNIAVQDEKRKKQGAKAAKKKLKQSGSKDVATVEEILAGLEETDAKRLHGTAHGKKTGMSQPTLTCCCKPGPRAACTLTVVPTSGEVLLFGGEYFDGAKATVFNDTYKWNMDKGEWRVVEGNLKTPQRRCAHQTAIYKDSVLLFGGEFSTIDQFYHFKDLWSFDIKTNIWSEVSTSGSGPSPRSGHRMIVWRSFLVVFGGFHDTLRETRYFDDLYFLCLRSMKWRKVQFPPHANTPPARSGCQFMLHQQSDSVLMYGGYAKVKDSASGAQGKQFDDCWLLNLKPLANTQGDSMTSATALPEWQKISRKVGQGPSVRSGASMTLYKNMAIMFGGVFDEDDGTTSLRSLFYNDLYGFDVEQKRWYLLSLRVRKSENSKRGRGGGKGRGTSQDAQVPVTPSTAVHDNVPEDGCPHDEEYESDIDQRTFGYIDQDGKLVRIPLEEFNTSSNVDDSKIQGCEEPSVDAAAPHAESDSGTTGALEETKTLSTVLPAGEGAAAAVVDVRADQDSHAAETRKPVLPTSTAVQSALFPSVDKPLPRINANLFVKGPNLYIYGGLVEIGKKTLTLDDCWKINLNLREAWECVERGTIDDHAWHEEESSEGSLIGDDDDEFSDGDGQSCSEMSSESTDASESESSGEEEIPQRIARTAKKVGKGAISKDKEKKSSHNAAIKEKMSVVRTALESSDPLMTPKFEETLRDFYERTQLVWMARCTEDTAAAAPLGIEGSACDDVVHPTGASKKGEAPKVISRGKELKREAFDMAARRYAKIEPLLEEYGELERIQREMEESANETKKTNHGKR
eukprot:Lankesteria_metandrocarpae@DN3712_c0_g1_i1.p1